jgi:hypothetical protein
MFGTAELWRTAPRQPLPFKAFPRHSAWNNRSSMRLLPLALHGDAVAVFSSKKGTAVIVEFMLGFHPLRISLGVSKPIHSSRSSIIGSTDSAPRWNPRSQ